jgi:hypothetical protein
MTMDKKFNPPYADEYPADGPMDPDVPINWHNEQTVHRSVAREQDLCRQLKGWEQIEDYLAEVERFDWNHPDFRKGLELVQTPEYTQIARTILGIGREWRRAQPTPPRPLRNP